ncbi:hypothetical protein FACS189483_04580 [Spirochaetia bacterium]|nr:hypothetical protein FACS189483_04580 [Spirochaetia bacterium]
MKKLLPAFMIALLLVSCKTLNYQVIIETPDAKQYILDEIALRKIIFIAEQHEEVNPILFMAENIADFYNAGVRYLFLEGGGNSLPGSEHYNFFSFFPWLSAGWKYEDVLFLQALKDLNDSLPEEDRLKIINAEAGQYFSVTIYNNPDYESTLLNSRDEYAFNTIASYMDNSAPGEKAIIFYGGSHGIKKPYTMTADNGARFTYKTLAARLYEKYGDDFFSFGYDCNQYDAVIIERNPVYGIFYQYMPTNENLIFIKNSLREYENTIAAWKDEEQIVHSEEQGQYLMAIYYLKLYFGDKFNYSFWNGGQSLAEALDELELAVYNSPENPADTIVTPMSIAALREYHHVMVESDIERLINGRKITIPNLITDMKKAVQIFPDDLWSYYWLAYAETLNGNYREAVQHWEYILGKPLSACMETLPAMYRMASACYQKLGQTEKSHTYSELALSLHNEHDLVLTNYIDIK